MRLLLTMAPERVARCGRGGSLVSTHFDTMGEAVCEAGARELHR